ncbi:HPP family protein [Paenibacillus sp. yr247]|uniref:HPP family protein n=1 Tax=Paenibacillus sp. yr247 TaxID=1761880 RepID=UPI0008823C44|nr:HPP family protein [Paenibacillus sp. yr247]SDP20271.1 HPP family protein [Paenibacillus sp. yr247]
MKIRILAIGLYLTLAYWASQHIPGMEMIFYPSLGSFSVILFKREENKKYLPRTIIAATVATVIGSLLHWLIGGIIAFFLTVLLTLFLMQRFNWTDAPVLAVALIPYFSKPLAVWKLPLAVFMSLVGLGFLLWFIHQLERRKGDSSLSKTIDYGKYNGKI